MSKQVTIVYTVEDEEAFQRGGNPLQYAHHGLRAHTIAVGDHVAARNSLIETLHEAINGDSERIRKELQ